MNVKYENDKLTACVEIENKGERLAEESVLIYIRDEVASVPQPVKKLVAVKKITVCAKETKKACLSIPKEELMMTGLDLQKRLESGWFTVMTGELSARIYIED